MLNAFLTEDLSAPQVYPLLRSMIRKRAVMGDLVQSISSATDITTISPRIVEVQPTNRPPESEQYSISEGMPVKPGSVWVQVWNTTPRDPGEITTYLNNAKRQKFNTVLEKGKSLKEGTFQVGSGEFSLSGDGFTRLVLMGTVPGARTIPIGPNAQGIMRYFDATDVQIASLVTSVSNFMDSISAQESALRDSIAAATTLAELEAIDIETGWPNNSQEVV